MLVPEDVFELLSVWHCTVAEIDPDYTLGDLLSLLRGVMGIGMLDGMLGCDVAAFLAEAQAGAAFDEADDGGLRHVEVFNRVTLAGYVADPARPDEPRHWMDDEEAEALDELEAALREVVGGAARIRMYDVSDDDPVTGRPIRRRVHPGTKHGRRTGPCHVERDCQGWGSWTEPPPGAAKLEAGLEGGFALGFTPVNQLVRFPLRYDAAVAFPDAAGGRKAVRFEERITITFGELVHALFRELGMMGTPGARDEQWERIDSRLAHLHDARDGEEGGGEPWR